MARETLTELLRAVDVLALPSRGEGYPLVAQEAMASGLAVLLGDDPALRQQVTEGAALFVPTRPAAIGEALERLLSRDDERRELGLQARRHAEQHWDQGRCRTRLLEAYTSLAEPPA